MKVVLFTEEFDTIIDEHETLEDVFDLYHEKVWGLTKKECAWDTERDGCFITQIYKPTVKVKNRLIKLGIPEDFFMYESRGSRVTRSTKNIAFLVLMDDFEKEDIDTALEDFLSESENEELTEKINTYIKSISRDKKIDDLLL
jgi:hypothetical protein